MATEKWSCTIDIPDPETAAYLVALIYGAHQGVEAFMWSTEKRIKRFFPGGLEAAEKIDFGICSGRFKVFSSLDYALESIGVRPLCDSPAPWLETQAPVGINGSPITCLGKQGIKISSNTTLSLEEMKAAVKECEEED